MTAALPAFEGIDRARQDTDGARARPALPPWLPPVAVLAVAAASFLIVTFGPVPVIPAAGSTPIRDAAEVLSEPRDRIVLAAWLGLAIVLALVSVWQVARRPSGARRPLLAFGLNGLAAAVVVAALGYAYDPYQMWFGMRPLQLAAGVALAVLVIHATAFTGSRWRPLLVSLAIAAVLVCLPAWIEFPSSVVDRFDFGFTSDELSAVAAGHFPLSDYLPQYTVLLPFLFAGPIRLVPSGAAAIMLAGIMAFQAAVLAIGVALPCLVDGRRHLPGALVVVVPGAFLGMTGSVTAATYFQSFPLRYVGPVVLILLTWLALRGRGDVTWRRPWRWLGLGFLAGLTALNNPDFGSAAAVVVLIVIALAVRPARRAVRALVPAVLALVAAPLAYAALGAATGRPVDLGNWLAFVRMFGVHGFYNVALEPFGLYVAEVALFIVTAVSGFVLLRADRARASTFRYRQGLLLALVGGWAMVTLPYLDGRSLPGVYIQGYIVAAGMCVAAFLPLISRGWRRLWARPRPVIGWARMVLPVLAVAAMAACVLGVISPVWAITAIARTGPSATYPDLADELRQLAAAQPANGGPALAATMRQPTTVQALPRANLLMLTAGYRPVNIASSPDYIEDSHDFAALQCVRGLPDGTAFLALSAVTARYLAAEPACAGYADWKAAFWYSVPGEDDPGFALVPVR